MTRFNKICLTVLFIFALQIHTLSIIEDVTFPYLLLLFLIIFVLQITACTCFYYLYYCYNNSVIHTFLSLLKKHQSKEKSYLMSPYSMLPDGKLHIKVKVKYGYTLHIF